MGPRISSGVVNGVIRCSKLLPWQSEASRLAKRDFPVPGGPINKTCSPAIAANSNSLASALRSVSPVVRLLNALARSFGHALCLNRALPITSMALVPRTGSSKLKTLEPLDVSLCTSAIADIVLNGKSLRTASRASSVDKIARHRTLFSHLFKTLPPYCET